jgi:hypothetical protein
MSEEKFVGYFRLLEACAEPGCPVCWLVIGESRSHLRALLAEQVTDPESRQALRRSWGFCNWHTWMLLEMEQTRFGSAILYEDLLRLALQRVEPSDTQVRPSRRRRLGLGSLLRRATAGERHRGRTACPICGTTSEAERRYLDTLTAHIEDGDVLAAYARSDGLCVPHLFTALEVGRHRPRLRDLVARTREKWARLRGELQSFVAKHDYRNQAPYTESEATATARASALLAGARGVFGNDAHGHP